MSETHVRRLAATRDEFEAARASIAYVDESWGQLKKAKGLREITRSSITDARSNIEATYIIRLFTRFESILKDALSLTTTRRRSQASQDPKAWEMIRDAADLYSINVIIKDNADQVRIFRNSLIHKPVETTVIVDFSQALAFLTTFVDALPDHP